MLSHVAQDRAPEENTFLPPPITPFSPLYLYPSIDQAFISLLEFESKRRRKDFFFRFPFQTESSVAFQKYFYRDQ